MEMNVSVWCQVNVGLRQGRLMSPWKFNVYLDGVVREVNAMVLGKILELLRANSGMYEDVNHRQLFADDTALVADSAEMLCRLVSEFGGNSIRQKKVETEYR